MTRAGQSALMPAAAEGVQPIGGYESAALDSWLTELLAHPRLISQDPRNGQLWCCESTIPISFLGRADRYFAAATLASSVPGEWRAIWQPKPRLFEQTHTEPQHMQAEVPPLTVAIGRLPLGSSHNLQSLADCQRLAADHPQLEWFGGLSFDTGDLDPRTWGQLAEGGFFSPRWLVNFAGSSSCQAPTLAVYAFQSPQDQEQRKQQATDFFMTEERPRLKAALNRWADALRQAEALPSAVLEEESPSFADWQNLLTKALDQSGSNGKVVLARQKTFTFASPVQLTPVVMNLATLNPSSYLFALSAPDGRSFVGCSPERLARWHHDHVEIDAMAGTRPTRLQGSQAQLAGEAGAEDADSMAAPCSELQQNPKDQHEHRFVTDFIHESLGRFCKDFRQETTESVVTLRHLKHMASRFEGTLDPCHHPLKLVEHLHPTPAVGGSPRKDALEFLRHNEPFSRGRFAAPIGNFNGQRGDFAIGIRSALVATDQMFVFAGAGIVKGSDPLLEWQEISVKMKNFTDIITRCTATAGSRDSQPHRHKDIS